MAHAGQEIQSPGGMRLRFVRTGAETDGELLEMEATYGGDGGMPPMHLHPRQAERFEVIEGAMRAIVDDEERVFETGERFEVPDGARELGERFFAEFHEEFRLTQPAD